MNAGGLTLVTMVSGGDCNPCGLMCFPPPPPLADSSYQFHFSLDATLALYIHNRP